VIDSGIVLAAPARREGSGRAASPVRAERLAGAATPAGRRAERARSGRSGRRDAISSNEKRLASVRRPSTGQPNGRESSSRDAPHESRRSVFVVRGALLIEMADREFARNVGADVGRASRARAAQADRSRAVPNSTWVGSRSRQRLGILLTLTAIVQNLH
jgi:hypothetical protein